MLPRERLVHDEMEPCPYLEGRMARMPLRLQLQPVQGAALDESLAQGDRRIGQMLYHTVCPSCHACEPIRLPVAELRHTRSQRRAWAKNQDLRVQLGPVGFSEEKLALFNRHKIERGLAKDGKPMGENGYRGWFTRTCTPTVETRYYLRDKLVGVGIIDVGRRDVSSVYFYFDPDESDRSLGVYSVLFESAWLRGRGGRYYYLGLYIAESPQVNYKARYFPHERLIGGRWMRFEGPDDPGHPVGPA